MPHVKFSGMQAIDASGRRVTLPPVARRRLSAIVRGILSENVLCSIATVGSESTAHINTAYFAFSEALELYFLSHPNSLHCRNLAEMPSVAATVMSSDQRWTAPGRGLQLFGRCGQARGQYVGAAEQVYQRRFSGYARWKASLEANSPGRDYRFYRFIVSTLKVLEERALGDGVFVKARAQRTTR